MIRQHELIERIRLYDPHVDEDLFNQAYVFSMEAHGIQRRESGEFYFTHPFEVAAILVDLRLDVQSIVTALLHDTVEDTGTTISDIEKMFGEDIACLVNGVTKLSKIELQSEKTKQAENFRKLVLAMSHDIRVLLVKLADRLHNMRTLHCLEDPERRRRIAHETMDIYVPLAERIGMRRIKDEMEDLAFSQLYPEVYESIKNRLVFLHHSSEDAIQTIIEELRRVLIPLDASINIQGRLKKPYSIWEKMQKQNISFAQLSDIMGFRVITETIPQCYQTLGFIHCHFSVVPGRFRDYISTPKSNGYRSLHTGLIGPLNHRIEVQIRTQEMHKISEVGVAAHWTYKGGAHQSDQQEYTWLRSLLEILENASNPSEFLEHTRLEMFQDQVFCFTPKGGLISLPKGSTPIDFAYAIHSRIGDCTVGVKINGQSMPLRTILQNGDQVDILTDPSQGPSPSWERFVVTGKARACIRKYIRSQQQAQFSELGHSLLEQTCLSTGLAFDEERFRLILDQFFCKSLQELLSAVGEGLYSAKEVVVTAYSQEFSIASQVKEGSSSWESDITPDLAPVPLKGLIPGIAIHYAGCCNPIPGDKIVGMTVIGQGVVVHTYDCESITRTIHPESIIDVSWSSDCESLSKFTSRLRIVFSNTIGSLATTMTVLSQHKGDLLNLKVTQRTIDFWEVLADVQVRNVEHVEDIQAELRSLPIVKGVERV